MTEPASRSELPACSAEFVVLYDELRRLAHSQLRRERREHTLQPTELVHETFLRLLRSFGARPVTREEFLLAAARTMRVLLIDHARRRAALKRSAVGERVFLDDALTTYEDHSGELLALEEALERLGALDPQLAQVVELRYFAGFSEEDAAQVLGLSARTLRRSWRVARMWLHHELEKGRTA